MKRIVVLIWMFLSGCGTFVSRDPFFQKKSVYPAIRFDAEDIKEAESPYLVFFVMDIPLSLVTDTRLISYDLLR